MSTNLFANDAASTLASAILVSATTCSLAPGTGVKFPNPTGTQYFIGTFTDAATGAITEIVKCTARTVDVLTIVRGQEGTTPRGWNAGDNFEMFWTAGDAASMLQQGQFQQQGSNYGVDTGTADAIVITLNPAPGAYADLTGAPIRVLVLAANATTTPTININGLGNVLITGWFGGGGIGIPVGTFSAGKLIEISYDGTQFQYNQLFPRATKAEVQGGTVDYKPVTPLELAAAYPGVVDSGLTGGHVYLPGGFLMQWGRFTQGISPPISITFAVAFSGTPIVTVTTTEQSSFLPAQPYVPNVTARSSVGFTVDVSFWNTTAFVHDTGCSFCWTAIGTGVA